jgi:hypothetical protein
MSRVTTAKYTSFQTISGYKIFADALYGDNGDPNGVPGYDVGASSTDCSSGYIVWEGDIQNGLDSGNVSVDLSLPPGGGTNAVQWDVVGGASGTLTFTSTYRTMTKVQLLAGVALGGCKMSWVNATIRFYKAGVLMESISLDSSNNPVADATSQSGSVEIEQITTITASSGYDRVDVSGNIRLQANAGVSPGADDIFADVYVFTS